MAIPLSTRKLSADYGVTLTRGSAPALADGATIGGTAITAAALAAIESKLGTLVPITSVTYNKASFTGSPLKKTAPDEVRGITVAAASANAVLELTLPTGAGNLGDVLTLTVALTEANPGSLNVVYGGGTLTAVANGQHTFHCTGTGVWLPMRNAAEILALQALAPVASAVYDAVGDFSTGAATVADQVRGVLVDITDANTALTLTLPTGAGNLGNVLTLTVALDGTTPGSLAVVCGGGATLSAVQNGTYSFQCTGTGVWKAITYDLYGANIVTVSDVTGAYTAYTIPDRINTFVLSDSNTVEGDKVAAVITLPTGAMNVGKTIRIAVYLGNDAQKHTLNIVLGTLSGTLTNLANGVYKFRCHTTGEWTRELTAQYGALTDFGPGAAVTGDISTYQETAFKALLTACAKAGIIADNTTT